ncbi:CapA family protein [Acetatifactor muris]|uniref:Capsule biosynthesis protein CapA n=1 Tax=Acetatifactor muris TaxID=879566 RepID=A0A2K4ZC97_9FIRM|nr:CapA family protein [Acetatifactor muris]MCR2046344.1 CapA family protein [Acetatifactor muris]SOY28088.1 Capsule biosynthesis protein CapA [Acetatifactor muris]
MMKKKLEGLLLLLCLALSGCGNREAQAVVPFPSAQAAEEVPGQPKDNIQPKDNTQPSEGTAGTTETAASEPAQEPEDTGYDFTVCFAGDINLDENWGTTQFMSAQENGIYDCISEELVSAMQEADIMCLNNEFTYSTGGEPLAGKAYTFRAMPERVEVLHQLGVDAVTLANNHVYDYGKEALLDTFGVLEEAEIPYFGAGRNLEEAGKPLYLEIQGKTVALVAASRAEKNKMTPQATDTEPGILRCYDTELFLDTIREAKENSDFCIAFVHWGTEYSFALEQVQPDTGKQYLDAGADAVIGAHTHCLQGMEYYDGKPIIYSLGNYWFNEKTLDTMLLQLHFSGDEESAQLTVQVIPAVQSGYRTVYAADAGEQRRIYDFLEEISVNVRISDEGIVSEVK